MLYSNQATYSNVVYRLLYICESFRIKVSQVPFQSQKKNMSILYQHNDISRRLLIIPGFSNAFVYRFIYLLQKVPFFHAPIFLSSESDVRGENIYLLSIGKSLTTFLLFNLCESVFRTPETFDIKKSCYRS